MKKIFCAAAIMLITSCAIAQHVDVGVKPTDTAKLYNPAANARTEIDAAVKRAAREHKNVFLQIGGNWCIWCIRFSNLVNSDPELNQYLRANYEVVHVNYSKENTNPKVMAELGFPQRFGFPVFVILDSKGNPIHIQNSGYLEEGKGHSKAKVLEFLKNWSPAAIDPKTYRQDGR